MVAGNLGEVSGMARETNGTTCALAAAILGPLCLLILACRAVWLTALAAWDASGLSSGRN